MPRFNDERVRAMIAGPRSFRTYPFPGVEGLSIAMRVLTEAELDDCRAAAQSELRDRAKLKGWDAGSMIDIDPDLLHRATERHIIFRATYDPETIGSADPARFFETPKDIAGLDSVTMTKLGEVYLEHQEWVSPLRQLEPSELEEVLAALGKSQTPELFLGGFAPSTLRRLALSLVLRLRGTT